MAAFIDAAERLLILLVLVAFTARLGSGQRVSVGRDAVWSPRLFAAQRSLLHARTLLTAAPPREPEQTGNYQVRHHDHYRSKLE
jgi:hypothetical protein